MKRLIVLFLGVLVISCSSDSSNGLAITSQNILGKWYLKGGTVNNGPFENYEHDCVDKKDFQEFFSNNELKYNGYDALCEINDTEISEWNLNGNTLTISNQNFDPMLYQYTYTVEKLTSSELVLKQTSTEPDGIFVYRITLTRNE